MKTLNQIAILLVVAGCVFSGCSGPKYSLEGVQAANDTNIKKMAAVYRLYAKRFGYRGPKSKEGLLDFMKNNESIERNLEIMGIERDKLDKYFISENDGEEFEFRWGAFVDPDTRMAKEPIVFEKTGTNGVRLVILANRKILEVSSDKKYETLLNGKVTAEEAKTDEEKEEEAAQAAESAL